MVSQGKAHFDEKLAWQKLHNMRSCFIYKVKTISLSIWIPFIEGKEGCKSPPTNHFSRTGRPTGKSQPKNLAGTKLIYINV